MTQSEYIKIIENQAAKPTSIKPVIKHINNHTEDSSLFLVEQFGTKFIYKISDPKTSFNNLMLAQMLLAKGVSVPDSKTFISNHQYFEKYEVIPGITLAMKDMLGKKFSTAEISQIIHEVLTMDKKISEITISDERIKDRLILADRRKHHHDKEFGKFLSNVFYQINKRQTTYGNVTLHHSDLNPSNILLDDNNHVVALLDLDSIATCDEYIMLSKILLFWPDVSINQVAKIYTSVFNRDLNINHLKRLLYFIKTKNKTATILRNIKQKTL